MKDLFKRAMNGEIAVGSYSPLPSVVKETAQAKKVSTAPLPLHNGRRGNVRKAEIKEIQSASQDRGKQVGRRDIFKEGEKTEEDNRKDRSTESERTAGEEKAATVLGKEEMKSGGEMEDSRILGLRMSKQLVPRRENSKLRELLRAIESYDRCVCGCVCVYMYVYLFAVAKLPKFYRELVATG